MKGFIRLTGSLSGDYIEVRPEHIVRASICRVDDYEVTLLVVLWCDGITCLETMEEIAAKIEEATEQKSEPRQKRSVCINNGMPVNEAIGILHDLQTKYVVGGNDSEIIDAIDVAFEAMGGYIPQNHYYRTSDRLPTAEDADRDGCVFVSESCASFCRTDTENAKMWTFWAPCPKVEVRE